MSDERITVEQVVAEAVAPFVETVGDAVETATAVLEALREAGFDVYRPDECALLEYWRDGQPYNHHILLIDDDDKPIFGASIPRGAYRLVPVKEGADA